MSKHTILFLAANPAGTDRLALDEEARAIQEELERSGHRNKFELVTRWAARPLDLLRELRKLRPTVVHFSGHGDRGELQSGTRPRRDIGGELSAVEGGAVDGNPRHGLFFQGPDGRPQLVSTAALKETFSAAGSAVKLVVLNACYSEGQAEALLAHVRCVVGMSGSVRDDTARNFAIGFYGGLGERESVATAYRQGRAAISLEGLPDSAKPQLKVRDGIDAEQFVLAVGESADASELALPDTEPAVISQVKPSTQIHEYDTPPWIPDADPLPVGIHAADRRWLRPTSTSISDTELETTAAAALSQDLCNDIAAPDDIASMSAVDIVSAPVEDVGLLETQICDPQRYWIRGEHGRGGRGRVSRAHDRKLGRDIAIKELISRDALNEVRFMREALITARLEHPGIVPVYEAGYWPDGTPFYAMKLVAGRSLHDLLIECKTIGERFPLLHHVIAVADALAYAHGHNIIHRDLKPANVIVGDFGETVVIDWGLAKDLTVHEESSAGDGPLHIARDGDLTTTGSVIGTPAYMPPEQRRGEPVDQRADVFAIGAMLWELCALRRTPPAIATQRRHVLRGAGIDRDLVAIIDKALDPDPDHRYPDAGALAADLKAFKSGARIAARSYSLFAMLAHWTRRHRALALSAVAAIAAAITGSLVYVRNIAVERDRADLSNDAARRAQGVAEISLDELTLKHAELLLTTDPSAAIDALARYRGNETARADQIRAHAAGLGVALLRAVPHTDNVVWAHDAPDGSILSLSLDGTIARTSRDGTSVVVSREVSAQGVSAYSASRNLLAYVCNPSDLCLFDVAHGAAFGVAPVLRNASFEGVTFSPDGTLLAVISHEAVVRILDITDPARPTLRLTRTIEGGLDIEFAGDDLVVVGRRDGIEFVRVAGATERFAVSDVARWAIDTARHEVALVTAAGKGLIVDGFPVHAVAQIDLCHGPAASIQFIPGRRSAAYACRDGAVGIWDLVRNAITPRAQLEGHADQVATSADGDYVIAAGGNGTVTVLDLTTDLIATYLGHGFRLTTLTPPGPGQPFLISGDVRGGVRAWPLPSRVARVAATSSSAFHAAIFEDPFATVIATTWLPALTVFSPATGVRTFEPHVPENIFLARSTSGRTFASFGLRGDTVELWASPAITRTRLIQTGHGSIAQLAFIDGSEDIVTAGHDGRLVRWTPSGDAVPLAQLGKPIDGFAHAAATGALVFSTVDGALWRTDAGGQPVALRNGGSRVNRLLALPDRQTVLAGYEDGDVIAIDTGSWQQQRLLHGGSVREIAVTADGRTIAVASNDGAIHVGTHRADAPLGFGTTWTALPLRARHVTLAPDGLLVASCTDGTIWLYDPAVRRWLCLPAGTVDLGRTAVTTDGKVAVALDFEGRLLWIDLDAARQLLQGDRGHPTPEPPRPPSP